MAFNPLPEGRYTELMRFYFFGRNTGPIHYRFGGATCTPLPSDARALWGRPQMANPSLESTEPRTLTSSGHPCVLTRGAHSVQTTPWLWCFQYFLSTASCTVTKYDTVHHSSRFHIPMHGYPCMDIRVCISVHGYPCMDIHVLAGHPFFMRQD